MNYARRGNASYNNGNVEYNANRGHNFTVGRNFKVGQTVKLGEGYSRPYGVIKKIGTGRLWVHIPSPVGGGTTCWIDEYNILAIR